MEDEFGCYYDTVITVQTIQGGLTLEILQLVTTILIIHQIIYLHLEERAYYSDFGTLSFDPSNTVANPTITASEPGAYFMGLFDAYCNDTLIHIVEFNEETRALSFSLDTFLGWTKYCFCDLQYQY